MESSIKYCELSIEGSIKSLGGLKQFEQHLEEEAELRMERSLYNKHHKK